MWIILLWIFLVWAVVGLVISYLVLYMCRIAERLIEEGDRELLPSLLQFYSSLENMPPGTLQLTCIFFWPYLLYQTFINS
jgi:recombinational DNA repair protein (RecF pathway)